ncbi:hypothetical protein QX226_14320 [Vibrio vulnificus]|nr:hypothetical protein [Vibrio vulnificus]
MDAYFLWLHRCSLRDWSGSGAAKMTDIQFLLPVFFGALIIGYSIGFKWLVFKKATEAISSDY